MSSESLKELQKDNIDFYLKEVSKEYRKLVGKSMPAELILIGGASVLINYGFRAMTTDIDAVIHAASSMEDAVNRVGDRYHLPSGWLNSDFTRTESFSPRLFEVSKYYRTFSNVVEIRTIDAEYLIAMKLRSGRTYKNDFSDILGILNEQNQRGEPVSYDQIRDAVCFLYGSWEELPVQSQEFCREIMENGNFAQQYFQVRENEKNNKELLLDFEDHYPDTLTEENLDSILENLKESKDNQKKAEPKKKRKKNNRQR